MFQSFEVQANLTDGPPRLAALRAEMAREGLDGFLVPRADVHQGEYVAARDRRLAWLTGFSGSAGMAVILPEIAGVFIDGRYRVQVRAEIDLDAFTPVPAPETKPGEWLRAHLPNGGVVGFDPWLHTRDEIARLEASLEDGGITLTRSDNLVDRVWQDRPPPPTGKISAHPDALAGETSASKRRRLAAGLQKAGQTAAVLTLPDSIAWLLNIRGEDLPRVPVAQAFAILHDDGRVMLFVDPAKLAPAVEAHLGEDVSHAEPAAFGGALATLGDRVRVDPKTAPLWVADALAEAGVEIDFADDPCILPKARKTVAELDGMRAAHLRDGAAMVEFLAWLDAEAPGGGLTEIGVVRALEGFRRSSNALRDISFDTIAGSGPHGAIVHYRVTTATDRVVRPGELLLVDSGGQYVDGTTDITRTVAVGPAGAAERAAFTRVLQGMIGISRLRWPVGLAGRDLDAVARLPLWRAGQDYDHGTGHGVGAFLSVHEGPQRLSRLSEVPLEPGMVLSNEPGYYREGAFGIRIENLVAVIPAPALPGADDRAMLAFETLTFVPIDRRLIDLAVLAPDEAAWLDGYHAEVRARLADRVSATARTWLEAATQPLAATLET